MKTNVETVGSLGRKLQIEVPSKRVNEEFEKAYKYLQREVNIKGFRKGKAPIAAIKSMYSDRVKGDVAQNIVQDAYVTALKEHKLTPVSMPQIDFSEITEDKDFSFTANFEIRPDAKIVKKEGFQLEKEKVVVAEDQVKKALENIQNSNASFEAITSARPLANGDFAIIDFDGFIDGKPLDNGSAKGHQLEIGANQFIPGFEEGLVGMNKGETREVQIAFPAEYHVEELKSKPVLFKVVLNEIKVKKLPEFNEELLKKIGQESLDTLKEQIKKDFESNEVMRVDKELRDNLFKQFIEANPVETPKSLVEEQKKALVEDFKNRMQSQGFSAEGFDEYEQKWNDDFTQQAEFMVKSAFLIDKLAEMENLHATDADVEKKFDEMAKQWNLEKEKIKSYYLQNNSFSKLSYQITEDNVYKYLLEKSTVKEVAPKKPSEVAPA
ncbi:MAG: trigger factor [Bdellovibrionaceae bacterium]|nr:trigger factor [Pseudobdellovibrionaceae bacterium]